jgi:hypothetical protein
MMTLEDIDKQDYIGKWVDEQTVPKLSEFVDTLKAVYASPLEYDFTADRVIELMENLTGNTYGCFKSLERSA